MKQTLDDFIAKHCDTSRPVLLGLSGGADSLALYHLLHTSENLRLAIAHVDHGWREESKKEAVVLQELAKRDGVRFHLKTLVKENNSGNQENHCRQQRIAFFRELCQQYGYQGVVLAHHENDQAETVLKRIFEGASLCKVGGILPETDMNGLKIWRPLLKHTKKELLNYVESKELAFFADATNEDVRYLRARMRKKLLPFVQEQFGKNISGNLTRMAEEAQELLRYLDERTDPFWQVMTYGPLGHFLDLSCMIPESELELRHLIRKFCTEVKVSPSREQLQILVKLLKEGAADKRVSVGDGTLCVDRKVLFAFKTVPVLKKFNPLPLGTSRFGMWKIEVKEVKTSQSATCWKALWKTNGYVVLPKDDYCLSVPESNHCFLEGLSIKKWWLSHKTPRFLRQVVPAVFKGNSVVHEFLTGRTQKTSLQGPLISIKIAVEDE